MLRLIFPIDASFGLFQKLFASDLIWLICERWIANKITLIEEQIQLSAKIIRSFKGIFPCRQICSFNDLDMPLFCACLNCVLPVFVSFPWILDFMSHPSVYFCVSAPFHLKCMWNAVLPLIVWLCLCFRLCIHTQRTGGHSRPRLLPNIVVLASKLPAPPLPSPSGRQIEVLPSWRISLWERCVKFLS